MKIIHALSDSKRVVIIITAIVSLSVYQFRIKREIWGSAVIMDGVGYFAYLPFVFETGATSFDGYCAFSHDNPCGPFFMRGPENAQVDKYYAGCALLWTPFYLTARFIEWLAGVEGNGYGKTTFLSIAIAGCCYLFLSLFAFRKVLIHLNINDKLIGITLVVMTFFTNVFWYAAREPSMSHCYSLALFCVLIWQLLEWKKTPNTMRAAIVFALLALIALVRPTNLLVVMFFPFFLGYKQMFQLGFKLYAWPVFLLIAGIQPLLYFLQTGHWWLWSYEGESFDFSNPHIMDTWFGPQKGLIIFFPVFAIVLFTTIWWLYKDWNKALKIVIPGSVIFYFLSSWHAWQYGWSFGIRAYVEFYPLLFLPLVFFTQHIWSKRPIRWSMLILLVPCLIITLRVQQVAINDYASLQDLNWEKWKQVLLDGRVGASGEAH